MKIPSKKTVIILVAALIAAAGVIVFVLPAARSKAAEKGEYETVKALVAIDRKIVEASGNIEPIRLSDLSFGGEGLITRIYAKEGQVMAKGSVILSLDGASEQYNLANTKYKMEQARMTGNARQAELAELEVAMRQTELDRTRLPAPFDGVIASIEVEEGEFVSNNKIVATIIDRSTLEAVLQIDEVDLPSLARGQRVEFTFEALSGRVYDGFITSIPATGTITSQGLAVFDVVSRIANAPAEILPGYSFSAQVIISEPRSIVTIPLKALVRAPRAAAANPDADKETSPRGMPLACYVPGADGKPELRRFFGIPRSDNTVEIISGIVADEAVLVPKTTTAAGTAQGGGVPGMGFLFGGGGGGPPHDDNRDRVQQQPRSNSGPTR